MGKITIIAAILALLAFVFLTQTFKKPAAKPLAGELPRQLISAESPNTNQPSLGDSNNHLRSISEAGFIFSANKPGRLSDLRQLPSLKRINTIGKTEVWSSEGVLAFLELTDSNSPDSHIITSDFISVLMDADSKQMLQISIHTPSANIASTRTTGATICSALRIDPESFFVWCDQANTNWLDVPLFTSKAGVLSGANQTIGFGVLRSYDSKTPWRIELLLEGK